MRVKCSLHVGFTYYFIMIACCQVLLQPVVAALAAQVLFLPVVVALLPGSYF